MSLSRSLLIFYLWASMCWTAVCLLKMDSCSCRSLSISSWTMASFSSSTTASSSSASSSQSSAPTAAVDMWAGWCNCTLEMSPKVGCSGYSAMVERFWVDGWWRDRLLVDSCGCPSSGCKRWLILLGGIVRVFFKLRTRWAPNASVNSRGLFIPEHEGG
jgi:hypothetical protein